MTRRFKYAMILTAAMLLSLVSCRKDIDPGANGGQSTQGEDTYIVLGLAMPGAGTPTTKAQSEWIQKVTLGNINVGIFEQDTGDRLVALVNYPGTDDNECIIGSNEYYQVAWKLSDAVVAKITANPDKKYKIVVGVNHPDGNSWHIFNKSTTWEQIMDLNPNVKVEGKEVFSTLNMSRTGNISTKLCRGSSQWNTGPQVNLWMSPIMTGTIENLTLGKGVNLIGFTPQGGSFNPAIDLEKLNSDLSTSYEAVPWCRDATEKATSHELALTPCYAQLIVNSIVNEVPDKFITLTDIFVMNVPMRFTSYPTDKTCYFNNKDYTNSPKFEDKSSLTFSDTDARSLLSGFDKTWIKPNMSEDNFVRFLHYPVDAEVTYEKFTEMYPNRGAYDNSSDRYKCLGNLALKDIDIDTKKSIPTDKANGVVKRMEENLATWNNTFWQNNPIFIISQNDGNYPKETTVNKLGERQYRYATRLVLRGKWKETIDSPEEIVYYPILVNHKDPIFDTKYDSETAETEKETLVKRGRRYIYDITIRNKGVSNPWTDADIDVELGDIELKVTPWVYANVELPKYIY